MYDINTLDDIKKYLSTNYILLPAKTITEKAYSKINRINPEFVIVYRKGESRNGRKLYYYTFLTKLLLEFKKQNQDEINSDHELSKLLKLQEYEGDKTFEISSMIPDANDPAIDELIKNNKNNSKLIPLLHGNSIVGVYDPNREDMDFLYTMKKFDIGVKRGTKPSEIAEKYISPKFVSKGGGDTLSKSSSFRTWAEPFDSSVEVDAFNDSSISADEPSDISSTLPKGYGGFTPSMQFKGNDHPTKIGKFASVKMHKNMKKDTKEFLSVQLKTKKPPKEELPEGYSVVNVSYPSGVSNVELQVFAMSNNPEIAEILNPEPHKMIVPKDGDSNIVEFKINPKKDGLFSITTIILSQSNPLAILQSHSQVGDATSDSMCVSTGVVNPDTSNPGADLTMIIKPITTIPLRFEIDVMAPQLGTRYAEFKHTSDCEDPEKFCRTTFATIEQFNPYRKTPEHINKTMSGIGIDLYNRLFPDDFKRFYWKNKNNIKTIQIISFEPWIPWEIIKPVTSDGNVAAGFLCEDHALTRWLSGVDIANKPTIKSIKVVQPKDTNLLGAIDEAKFLEDFWEGQLHSIANFSKVSSLDEVTASLESGDFDILHFTTHGAYNPQLATQSEILLENNQVLTPIDLSQPNIKIQKSKPLVILNACQTGNGDYVLTGIGGWSESFLKKSASAFIGTLWSVGDTTALNFTKSLYTYLKAKKPLDESVKLARLDVKNIAQETGDPSWLAYSLYAQPNATFELV